MGGVRHACPERGTRIWRRCGAEGQRLQASGYACARDAGSHLKRIDDVQGWVCLVVDRGVLLMFTLSVGRFALS